MSTRAFLNGIVDMLRKPKNQGGAGIVHGECGLAPVSGRPPAGVGEKYAGVWAGARSTEEMENGIYEVYSAIITVTYRITGRVPWDRIGTDIMVAASGGMCEFTDNIRWVIGRDFWDQSTLRACNAHIPGGEDGFTTGLRFGGDTVVRPVSGEWFHARAEEVGIVADLRFSGMVRAQRFAGNDAY